MHSYKACRNHLTLPNHLRRLQVIHVAYGVKPILIPTGHSGLTSSCYGFLMCLRFGPGCLKSLSRAFLCTSGPTRRPQTHPERSAQQASSILLQHHAKSYPRSTPIQMLSPSRAQSVLHSAAHVCDYLRQHVANCCLHVSLRGDLGGRTYRLGHTDWRFQGESCSAAG